MHRSEPMWCKALNYSLSYVVDMEYVDYTRYGETDDVGEVRFSVMSGDDVRAASVCEVVSAELYNGTMPVPGGLYDPRMGAFEFGTRCHTCHHNNKECPGHPGHIELAAPMFNVELRWAVQKVLRCVCTRCAALLIAPEDPLLSRLLRRKVPNAQRFEAVLKACAKVKHCHTCGSRKADSIAWDRKTSAAYELTWKLDGDKASEKAIMDAGMVEGLFRRISSADAAAMGVLRPDALLLTALPVPPIAVRPPAKNSSGQRRDDDLTIKLSDIIKNNILLRNNIEAKASAQTLQMYTTLLQHDCITYINNATTGVQPSKVKATNRALRSVTSRLKGKEGRVRGNLLGKRVDMSARSVVTPDPNISVEELGVPLRIAKTLTMPEVVREDNRDRLQDAVETGPTGYPGAIFVKVLATGSMVHLKRVEARRRVKLELGDVVHRHMLDGDIVLFNRQPSLHRMSMMAHKVRVMPYDTFRLNVLVTASYNADFDGDEMNLHLPQSGATATEIRILAGVASQILTPRQHEPIVGIVQDVALGVHLITNGDVKINRKAAMNLIAHMTTCNAAPVAPTMSGRDMLSKIFPPTLQIETENERIVNGRLIEGQIGKTAYQRPTTGVLHSVFKDLGPARAVRLLDDTQSLVCNWLMQNGFSVGIGDIMGGAELEAKVESAITKAYERVDAVFASHHEGTFQNDTFMTAAEKSEADAQKILQEMFEETGLAAKADSESRATRLIAMVIAKSKGSTMNVCQMMGAVGQQEIDGKRMPLSFEGRVLPHFARYDDSAGARGLVESSFLKGLEPKQFFFHATAGREGLIDTAVKSVTGDTPIVILENDVPRCVMIGDWIDGYLEKHVDAVRHFEERQMELLDLETPVYIPTTDEDGCVTWGEVTAMTRHDPGTELYKIETVGGRRVIVTESKSLLIWKPELQKFQETLTPEIRVGDRVPVTKRLAMPPTVLSAVEIDGRSFELGYDSGVAVGKCLAGATKVGEDVQAFVGDGKAIPTAAFFAPESFIRGLLDGFFAVHDPFSDAFKDTRVMEGMVMLYSRIGVFAVPADDGAGVMIPNSWMFEEQHDVVLDPIAQINVIDVAKYPKVYDLTIPSTLNFGLANGLQVRDTSETGYSQRKCVKFLEDSTISHDRSVQVDSKRFVQFMFGEDGMDACAIETQTLHPMKMNLETMADEYLLSKCDLDGMEGLLTGELLQSLREDDALWPKLKDHFRQIVADKDYLSANATPDAYSIHHGTVFLPVAFDRLLTTASRLHETRLVDLHPAAALEAIDDLIAKMAVDNAKEASPLMAAMIRTYLSPKVLMRKYRIGARALQSAVIEMVRAFTGGLAAPSEMVGIVAAQSIAEPLTQSQLNSFHSAGNSVVTSTLGGVSRFKELISVTKNPKTPSMNVYMVPALTKSREAVLALRDKLQKVTVGDVTLSTALVYDTSDFNTQDPADRRLAALYKAFNVETEDPESSPWMLRLVLNRKKMMAARLHMYDVHRAVTTALRVSTVYSDDGSQDLVMRIRPPATSADMVSELSALEDTVMGIQVSGITAIKKAVEQPDESMAYDKLNREWVKRTDEHMLSTRGSSLLEVLALDGIDTGRTDTNDIVDVYNTLGIEACRAAMLRDMIGSFSGSSYVNYRHLALLVDMQTLSGFPTSVDRHGMAKGIAGPIAKSSYEQPVDVLAKAAVFRDSDPVTGVSASAWFGKLSSVGTGAGQLLLDDEAFMSVDGEKAPAPEVHGEAAAGDEIALDAILAIPLDSSMKLPDSVLTAIVPDVRMSALLAVR